MLIHSSIFYWEGFGGKLRLASGNCHLRIFNLEKEKSGTIKVLKPFIIVVSDIPGNNVSIRSCAGHIATKVTSDFGIDPHRMVWVEYYPEVTYGKEGSKKIPEKYEAVDFTWKEGKALLPKWRPLKPPLLNTVRALMESGG